MSGKTEIIHVTIDGQTYNVEAPVGQLTDVQAYQLVRQQLAAGTKIPDAFPTAPMGGPAGAVANRVSQFMSGLTLNHDDEINGFMQALYDKVANRDQPWAQVPFGELYRSRQQQADAQKKNWLAAHPTEGGMLNAAGVVAPALAATMTGTAPVAAGTTALERIGAGTAYGAGYGALAGEGDAPDGQEVQGATDGAISGAAIGAGIATGVELLAPLVPLKNYVQDVVGKTYERFTAPGAGALAPKPAVPAAGPVAAPPPASAAAMDTILRAIERDRMTPLDLLSRTRAARDAGAPMPRAAAGGRNLQGAARGTVTLPGQGGAIADANLNGPLHVADAAPRMLSRVEQLAGIPAQDADAVLASRKAAARVQAKQDYAAAEAAGPISLADNPELLNTLESVPAFAKAHEGIRQARGDYGWGGRTPIAPLFDDQGRVVRSPTAEDIDMIKKGIDARLGSAKGGAFMDNAKANEKAVLADAVASKEDLLRQVDALNQHYAVARARHGDAMEIQRAIEAGKTALSMTPRQLREEMGSLSDAGREEFRMAAVDGIRQMLLQAADRGEHTNLAKALFGTGHGERRELLATLFGDGPAFAKFEQQMRSELASYNLRNTVFSGSQTANKIAEAEGLADDALHGAAGVITGHPGEAVVGIGKRIASRLADRNASSFFESVRDDMAQNLFRPGNAAKEADAFLLALEKLRQERIERGMRLPFYGATSAAAAGSRVKSD